jgi:hypothetical protein
MAVRGIVTDLSNKTVAGAYIGVEGIGKYVTTTSRYKSHQIGKACR